MSHAPNTQQAPQVPEAQQDCFESGLSAIAQLRTLWSDIGDCEQRLCAPVPFSLERADTTEH